MTSLDSTIRLDIGSGGKASAHLGSGWLGVDPFCKDADVNADMWDLPFADDSVDEIFTSHALEHISKAQVAMTLREWQRVLKYGAKLTIRVPDLEWCCRNWLSHQTTGWEMDTIYGHQGHPGEFHKTGFSKDILQQYARQAGLCVVHFERLKTHGQETLSLECTKSKYLDLSNISLVAIDSARAHRTAQALKHCLRQATFKNAFLFTDVRLELPDSISYSDFMMHDFPVYREMFGSHVLIVQSDGYIIEPGAWSSEFLQYDYIGAPWHDHIVGNGGFSLRSKFLLDTLAKLRGELHATHPEDAMLCRHYRSRLEDYGIKFAPLAVANRFSVENAKYQGSFGYHGGSTEAINNISLEHSRSDASDLYNLARLNPSDIHEHVELLSSLGAECEHITEFCSRTKESTSAFLFAIPQKLISYNVTGSDAGKSLKSIARSEGIDFHYHMSDVLDVDIEETDLLFIDTYHTYDRVRTELSTHARKVHKYIVLHDTTTFGDVGDVSGQAGLWPAIEEFLGNNADWSLFRRYSNNNGLTILVKHGAACL